MNPNTGEIKMLDKIQAMKEGFTIPLKRKPKEICLHCYGRGHIGKNDQGKFVPCRCTQ